MDSKDKYASQESMTCMIFKRAWFFAATLLVTGLITVVCRWLFHVAHRGHWCRHDGEERGHEADVSELAVGATLTRSLQEVTAVLAAVTLLRGHKLLLHGGRVGSSEAIGVWEAESGAWREACNGAISEEIWRELRPYFKSREVVGALLREPSA